MKKLSLRLPFLLAAVIGVMLLLPRALSARPPDQPPIPHSIQDHADCLSCHSTGAGGAPQFPADHQGRTNLVCLGCHKQGTPAAGPQATAPAGGPPLIPHDLQGRDNCLACHATGLAGAPRVPDDHAGRTVDTCRTCHQPAQSNGGRAPLIVPTPIAHPQAAVGQDSCVSCHAGLGGNLASIVVDWKGSIHSERGVGCADCHGGDPTKATKEEAMSAQAGFKGTPFIFDIPALCASCHSRVEAMRQYDLATDQYDQYRQSVHGQNLARGDVQVATCFTCHDGHGTKQVNDPSSKAYPLNVPALCASCHSDAELMKPYGIPTNQYELYQQSVHGVALLQKQNLRAPTCATCHGTHGAAPPGFGEVANVCGSCHSATQDYFLKSQHAGAGPGTPKCVTCHGRYDVTTPSEAMFAGNGARQCGGCHGPTSPQAETVHTIETEITGAAAAVDQADAAIQRAAGNSLIVAPEAVKLAQARTSLITARAAQHTLDVAAVKENTDKAKAKANEIIADAGQAADESLFRRVFMAFGLAVMALAIGSLVVIRRELYRELPKD